VSLTKTWDTRPPGTVLILGLFAGSSRLAQDSSPVHRSLMPLDFGNPTFRGYRIAHCLDDAKSGCGQEAADRFCKAQVTQAQHARSGRGQGGNEKTGVKQRLKRWALEASGSCAHNPQQRELKVVWRVSVPVCACVWLDPFVWSCLVLQCGACLRRPYLPAGGWAGQEPRHQRRIRQDRKAPHSLLCLVTPSPCSLLSSGYPLTYGSDV
jgi:hypothetical protein